MKTIDKIEIEYVVPETVEEQNEISAIIARFETEKGKPLNLNDFKRVEPKSQHGQGYWRMRHV